MACRQEEKREEGRIIVSGIFEEDCRDEVALYDHALSPARILSHYFAGLDLSPTDPALLQLEVSGGLIVLDWTGTDLRLQSAEDITGPWTMFPEALPPFTVSPIESKQFYRLSNE